MKLKISYFPIVVLAMFYIASAQPTQWRLLRPSNTGVPGDLIQTRQTARWAPDGKFWVAARWFFQQEGGIGMYDLNNDIWTVLADWETPLPSEFVFDVEFAADGSAGMATDSGLVHYDAGNWTIFDPTNSPLVHYEVQDISIAPDGAIWVNNTNRVTQGGDAVWRFDGVSQWQSFSVANGDLPWPVPWEELGEVYAAADGSVWVTNHFLAGVARYDGNSWTLFGDNLSSFISLNEDNIGNLWMIGNPAGGVQAIYKFDGAAFTSWPVANPNTLTIDRIRNQIYVGTWDGVIYRSSDGGGFSTTPFSE
ncbi:MAG: hypothetical protein Kow0042_23270 [Calditrichia bacterium]